MLTRDKKSDMIHAIVATRFFFYHLLCMLSHETASSSAWCKPPENGVIGQWLAIWSIVCRGFPHMHDGSEAWCHRTRLAAHRPWPVQNLFNVDHRCRCRLKPGGQMVGSVMSDWLSTVVLNHASVHSDAAVASGAGLSNQTGCHAVQWMHWLCSVQCCAKHLHS